MATIVTRAGKGTPLTNDEVDANFTNLNSDKLEVELNDLTTTVTWTNVPDSYITASSVTQHESALTITESQISDLQSYLTSETSHADVLVDGDFSTEGFMKTDGSGGYSVDTATYLSNTVLDEDNMSSNSDSALATQQSIKAYVDSQVGSGAESNDLTSAVIWADVPDANITESSVTQHQTAINSGVSITESQISNLQSYLTSYTETDPVFSAHAASGITSTQISNWDTAYGWDNHASAGYLTSYTEANNLSTAVTWANVPNANITESSVTQHETALSITESQISDFGTYLTTHQDISGKANLSGATFTGTITAPNVDISTTGSVTTNIATGGNNGNTTDVKVVNIGTGYGAGFYAGLSTTINMGSQSSNAQNIFNIGNGTTSGFGENTINLKGNVTVDGTVDGRDIATDGTKLDGIDSGATESYNYSNQIHGTYTNLTTAIAQIGSDFYLRNYSDNYYKRFLEFSAYTNYFTTSSTNDLNVRIILVVPSSSGNAVDVGSVENISIVGQYNRLITLDGDVTHWFSDYAGIGANSNGATPFASLVSSVYNPNTDKTAINVSTYAATVPSVGDSIYVHPFDWETTNSELVGNVKQYDAKAGYSSTYIINDKVYFGNINRFVACRIKMSETASSDSVNVQRIRIHQTDERT